MTFASTSLVFDPVAPWSAPGFGLPALALAIAVVTSVTVLSYLVGRRGSWRRFFVMLFLRLAALAALCFLLLRPALAFVDEIIIPTKLLILLDSSRSMAVADGFNNKSRWEDALRLLHADSVKAMLKDLQDRQRVEIAYYQADANLADLDAGGKPTGNRTKIGWWLEELLRRMQGDKNLRGLIVFSDGADNGILEAVQVAARWRSLSCPIYTIGMGSPVTTPKRNDIFIDPNSIYVSPSPVYVKGKMKVKAVVHAPGFEGVKTGVHVFIDDKKKKSETRLLANSFTNEIELACDAPDAPGDYKVTLKVDPVEGEVSDINNEISTYVTVTKEGLSVLWVEGKLRLEASRIIRKALSQDPRIRVYYSERPRTNAQAGHGNIDWFKFDKRHYDVIVIGDISGSRFCGGDANVFKTIRKMVEDKGAGVLMLGGAETFGNTDWQNYGDFTAMLPVDLSAARGRIDGPLRVVPTEAGFDHYIMRLTDDAEANKNLWATLFHDFPSVARIGQVLPRMTTLAKTEGDEPLLAFRNFGKGRVAVFGGDTTYYAWAPSRKAFAAWQRFWNRMIRWLARQEEIGSDVFVKLDARRLPAGANQRMGVTVGLRDQKPELKKKKIDFRVHVTDPKKRKTEVTVYPAGKGDDRRGRGVFLQTDEPGEYEVVAVAVDENGKSVGESAKARFWAWPEDVEMVRPAADHEHLRRIARAGDGYFRQAGTSELEQLLREIKRQTAPQSRPQGAAFPNWDGWYRHPAGTSPVDQFRALWLSGVLVWYLLFCGLLCAEWYLRRKWNMV